MDNFLTNTYLLGRELNGPSLQHTITFLADLATSSSPVRANHDTMEELV
jgi:hypothetical protein